MAELIKKLMREPLLHFLLLGATIFAAYSLINKGTTSGDSAMIVVTQGQIASLTETFIRTKQRPPTSEEVDGLIRDRVQEEVLYREALALRLDKDDVIIRRRLRQKMAFLSESEPPMEPSDEQLKDYLKTHAKNFTVERRFSFRQVYLNPQRHSDLSRDESRILDILNQSHERINFSSLGDPLMLERAYDNVSSREVKGIFGEKFARSLNTLSTGKWVGPVESSYGAHIVFLAGRSEDRLPQLNDVRESVRREFMSIQQSEAAAKSYQALLRKYAVTVEAPPAVANTTAPVATR